MGSDVALVRRHAWAPQHNIAVSDPGDGTL